MECSTRFAFNPLLVNGCRDIEPQTFWSHDLDPFRSRDVISHMTIGTTHGPFQLVVCWHQVTISHGWWDITRHNLDNHIPIVNTLETNFGDFGGIGIMPFFSNLSLAAAERRSVNY